MAATNWSWQKTQALLQRLHQPTPAALEDEYGNVKRLFSFLTTVMPPAGGKLSRLPLPKERYAALMQQWCGVAKQLLSVLADQGALKQHPDAAFSAGRLLSLLANCLACWSGPAADEAAERAVELQIAQHTAGLLPLLARQMAATAAAVSKATAKRHRRAGQPETAKQAAEAAYAQSHFPQHADTAVGMHLLSLWKALASNWPGNMLRTRSSQGIRGSSSSGGGCSTPSLQETVLPACELAVSILKRCPPNAPSSAGGSSGSGSGSSSDSDEPYPGATRRSNITNEMFLIANVLLGGVHNELLVDRTPLSVADAKFASQLSASAAVQHLLLLQAAFACHIVHEQQQGVSPIPAKAAAAAVTGSRQLAAAAAAAEGASSRVAGSTRSGSKQQQQYMSAPAHHRAVCDLLLVPADSLTIRMPLMLSSLDQYIQVAAGTVIELVLRFPPTSQQQGPGLVTGQSSPLWPPELCAPLHCMLAQAAALAPASLGTLHVLLAFMETLHSQHLKATLGPSPSTDPQEFMAAVNAATASYSSALTASLELLGPAVLHAYKRSQDTDPDCQAVLRLFGSVIVRIAHTPAVQDALTAAFQQRPFSSAAVCEAAVRSAARNSAVLPDGIRMFASLTRVAVTECAAAAPPYSNSMRSTLLTAAVADSSTRDALLLQFGLITTHLKYAASSPGCTSVYSGLIHHVMPAAVTAARLLQTMGSSLGIDSGGSGSSTSSATTTSSSSSSSSPEEHRVRGRTMAPWIHLCGRCLYFGGSQLLLALEETAAATAPGLDGSCLGLTEQALDGMLAVLLTLSNHVCRLQLLQPEGTCILHGLPDAACKELERLVEDKLEAAMQEWEGVLGCWKAAARLQTQQIAARAQSSGSVSWGQELQQLLRTAVPTQTAAALRDAGAAVCAEFPLKLCCNNPGCTSMGKAGEMLLGSSCSGCKAARYCSKACQGAAWKMGHSKVCKRITKAAGAAAAAPRSAQ